MTHHISNALQMSFSDAKLTYESLMTYIFPQVYPILFPMYQKKVFFFSVFPHRVLNFVF
jgi:hypothetical protein